MMRDTKVRGSGDKEAGKENERYKNDINLCSWLEKERNKGHNVKKYKGHSIKKLNRKWMSHAE